MNYVIYNAELGLFFSGFGNGTFSKYAQKAKLFCDFGYAYYYLKRYSNWFDGFKVYSFNQVAKVVLYA